MHLFGPTQLSPIFRLFAAGPWHHRTKKAKGNHQIHGEKWKCCRFHNDVSGSDFCCSSRPLIQMLFLLLDLQGMVFRSRTVATAPTQSIATRCYLLYSLYLSLAGFTSLCLFACLLHEGLDLQAALITNALGHWCPCQILPLGAPLWLAEEARTLQAPWPCHLLALHSQPWSDICSHQAMKLTRCRQETLQLWAWQSAAKRLAVFDGLRTKALPSECATVGHLGRHCYLHI